MTEALHGRITARHHQGRQFLVVHAGLPGPHRLGAPGKLTTFTQYPSVLKNAPRRSGCPGLERLAVEARDGPADIELSGQLHVLPEPPLAQLLTRGARGQEPSEIGRHRNEADPIVDKSICIGRDDTDSDATMATTRGTYCSTSSNN